MTVTVDSKQTPTTLNIPLGCHSAKDSWRVPLLARLEQLFLTIWHWRHQLHQQHQRRNDRRGKQENISTETHDNNTNNEAPGPSKCQGRLMSARNWSIWSTIPHDMTPSMMSTDAATTDAGNTTPTHKAQGFHYMAIAGMIPWSSSRHHHLYVAQKTHNAMVAVRHDTCPR